MSWSKSIAQYTDIAAHLDMISNTNVRQLKFDTPTEAHHWRSRVYMYRTILRESAGNGRSHFDRFLFRITKADPCTVQILEGYSDNITFLTADGGPIQQVEPVHPTFTPEELQQAIAAREAMERRFEAEDTQGPTEKTRPQSLKDLGL